ncbi:hypothetical protein EJ04DRAFT_584506, partial [Polyplosphaeria fusca]
GLWHGCNLTTIACSLHSHLSVRVTACALFNTKTPMPWERSTGPPKPSESQNPTHALDPSPFPNQKKSHIQTPEDAGQPHSAPKTAPTNPNPNTTYPNTPPPTSTLAPAPLSLSSGHQIDAPTESPLSFTFSHTQSDTPFGVNPSLVTLQYR